MERENKQRIVQSIIAENPYQHDEEWQLWFQLEEMVESNFLTPEEAHECYQEYLKFRGLI